MCESGTTNRCFECSCHVEFSFFFLVKQYFEQLIEQLKQRFFFFFFYLWALPSLHPSWSRNQARTLNQRPTGTHCDPYSWQQRRVRRSHRSLLPRIRSVGLSGSTPRWNPSPRPRQQCKWANLRSQPEQEDCSSSASTRTPSGAPGRRGRGRSWSPSTAARPRPPRGSQGGGGGGARWALWDGCCRGGATPGPARSGRWRLPTRSGTRTTTAPASSPTGGEDISSSASQVARSHQKVTYLLVRIRVGSWKTTRESAAALVVFVYSGKRQDQRAVEMDGRKMDSGWSAIDGQRKMPFTALHLLIIFADMSWKLMESGVDNNGGLNSDLCQTGGEREQ